MVGLPQAQIICAGNPSMPQVEGTLRARAVTCTVFLGKKNLYSRLHKAVLQVAIAKQVASDLHFCTNE